MFIRIMPLLLIGALVWAAWAGFNRQRARRARPARPATQASRSWKRVPAVDEDCAGIRAFLESHLGVEAYVEPRTMMNPLSVVLVDEDGQSARFNLRDDSYLRQLSRERGLRVIDAARFGYPERMRRRRTRAERPPDTEPMPDGDA